MTTTESVPTEAGPGAGEVRVHNLTMSVDGYCAGPGQSLDDPMGRGARALHEWALATRTFRRMFGAEGGSDGLDERFAAAGDVGVGATIMGRNMFGPVRGPWPDESWRGWWGERPPYGHPVFVLTHHDRPSLTMEGGTVFHFVTGGPVEALELARAAAHGAAVRSGGGAATVATYLALGLVDHLHVALAPVLLGAGERPFARVDAPGAGYRVAEVVAGEGATHITITRAP
ncbi:MAG: dihydrofolate reductase family protein [Miltoncostaeaceae bacterium]